MSGEGGSSGAFHPFDVSAAHLAYAVLGGFVVAFGMFSLVIKEKLYLGEAPIATIFGIIIGPYALGLFDPHSWGNGNPNVTTEITLEVTRVVLAIGVFAIGVELPSKYMQKHWQSLFFMIFPTMTYGWFASSAIIFALVPGLNFLSSLVIGACLTPTDPILAAAVVGGKYAQKHVPAHIRHILAAESACNDGAAFPFLFIALYLVLEQSDSKAVGEWFYITWLYEVLLGTVFGALLGYSFRHLMKFCERKNLIDRHSIVAQYISLAMLAIGATTLLGSDDLLAAFACGTAFTWDGWFNQQTEESQFSNVIDLLFNCACFIYIGAWIPFSSFANAELTLSVWRLVVIGILILLLRRLPAIVALYRWIPDIKTLREAVFSGHFGPMGVGAIFISSLARLKLPATDDPSAAPTSQTDLLAKTIQPIVAFMVLCSVVTHGLSIPFFSLGRRVHSLGVTYTGTWSRRQSIDPAYSNTPEWANLVRRLPTRAEDIVINRDADVDERKRKEEINARDHAGDGESPAATSLEDQMEKGQSPTGQLNAKPAAEEKEEDIAGEDGIREWREGRHLVVERRLGGPCNDEVEVKVFKDVFTLSDDGHEAAALELIEGAAERIKAWKRKDEPERPPVISTDARVGKSQEEEWKDEDVNQEAEAEGSGSNPQDGPTHKSKPPSLRKHIAAVSPSTSRKGRRRDSVRRAIFTANVGRRPSTAPAVLEGEGEASSSSGSSPADSPMQSRRGSPSQSVIELHSPTEPQMPVVSRRPSTRPATRNSSPATGSRIRFADDPTPEGNSPGSPQSSPITRTHSGLIHGHTRPPHTHIPATSESAVDSNRVAFDLPPSKN